MNKINRRSPFAIVGRLIVLVKPMLPIMAAAIVMGVAGHFCATFITIFGGFAPNSQTAEALSNALGSWTVLTGSISKGKDNNTQSLQKAERALLSPDEQKNLPKGDFIVMKTGTHPMRTKLQLYFKWGISFEEPYQVPERANREVYYAGKEELLMNIRKEFSCQTKTDSTQKAENYLNS